MYEAAASQGRISCVQIAVLRCILQRQAVAALLERDAALVAELAQDAEKHGPLALLHLPLSEYKPVEPEGESALSRQVYESAFLSQTLPLMPLVDWLIIPDCESAEQEGDWLLDCSCPVAVHERISPLVKSSA